MLADPINAVDPTGRWVFPWEALDAVSFHSSQQQWVQSWNAFTEDPNWRTFNTAAASFATNAFDGLALMLPVVPASGGHAQRAINLIEDAVHVADVPGDGAGRKLLHGTDAGSADDIVANGINRDAAAQLGGGDVFWMTESGETARIFAQANPAGGAPAVVGADLDAAVIESLVERGVMRFDDTNSAWQILDWEAFNDVATFVRFE
ncbi:MAG: hypothetical protein ACREF4_06780 [Gammaproteobacteria bacterium]